MEKQLWRTRPSAIEVFEPLIAEFKLGLIKRLSLTSIEAYLVQEGRRLWWQAVNHAQSNSDFDDRPLYWTRLGMLHQLQAYLADFANNSSILQNALQLRQRFETASRGLDQRPQVTPASAIKTKRILISGFDPFGLNACSEKSNTSGACVLALHNQNLEVNGVTAQVTGALFPVRYADFDEGIVESFFSPFITAVQPPDLVMTISQNLDDFKVERFAGRRRSTESFTDNDGCISGGTRLHPIEPAGLLPGPEFIETSLPANIIRAALGRHQPLANELRFMEFTPEQEPHWKFTTPDPNAIAVCGSGGGFLSNEIFYRCSLLRLHSLHKNLRIGHLHIPALHDNNDAGQRHDIVNRVKNALLATLPYL